MSVTFNKAMGYGMPWADFRAVCPLVDGDDNEALYDAFDNMTEASMTVPREIASATFRSGAPTILEPSLLSETYTDFGRAPAKIVSGSKLWVTVDPMDVPSNIIFFPNATFAKKWRRRADDLDIYHEAWRGGDGQRGKSEEIRTYSTYLEDNFYPFANYLMLANGEPVEWDHFEVVKRHPEWFPAVPTELRWYLPKHGVLKIEDVLRLRPIIAQWWS